MNIFFQLWGCGPMLLYYLVSQIILALVFGNIFSWILCPSEIYVFGIQVKFFPLSLVFALLTSSIKSKTKQNNISLAFDSPQDF